MTSSGSGPKRSISSAANASIDRLYEVDRLALGSIHRPSRVVARPGGKGLNAARAAAALGARVTAVGIVGGRAGDWIVERASLIDSYPPRGHCADIRRQCAIPAGSSDGAEMVWPVEAWF